MHFDRFDICAAWNLYLQHTYYDQWCPKYARLCKLQRVFKPARSEEFVDGLSENARAIYDNLMSQESGE
jgi:hypothetical protein